MPKRRVDRRTEPRGHRLKVLDVDRFRAIVRGVVDFAGGQVAVAKLGGISQSTLSKWLAEGELVSVAERAYNGLRKALWKACEKHRDSPDMRQVLNDVSLWPDPSRWPPGVLFQPTWRDVAFLLGQRLERAVFSDRARLREMAYGLWCADSVRLAKEKQRTAGIRYKPGAVGKREAELRRLISRIENAHVELATKLQNNADRCQLNAERVELAWWRILGPLLETAESGGIERGWQDLDASELRKFVRRGVDREIALFRDPIKTIQGGETPKNRAR
jgi:hypothetical protein